MSKKYRKKVSVFNVKYHIVFCPKFRRPVLIGDVEKRLKETLKEKASQMNCKIEKMEVMPDHVHVFIKAHPSIMPHYVVAGLKGYSSSILRKEFPKLKSRLPNLWTRSYYIETIGNISEKAVLKYIENQKGV